jgi:hypothetical protein
MNRRDFLKLSGLVSVAGLVQFNPLGKLVMNRPVEAEAGGKLYRGTYDGKVYISENAGKSWQLHTDFGAGISILDLAVDALENIHARLAFGEHSFRLALSPNSKNWKTA